MLLYSRLVLEIPYCTTSTMITLILLSETAISSHVDPVCGFAVPWWHGWGFFLSWCFFIIWYQEAILMWIMAHLHPSQKKYFSWHVNKYRSMGGFMLWSLLENGEFTIFGRFSTLERKWTYLIVKEEKKVILCCGHVKPWCIQYCMGRVISWIR